MTGRALDAWRDRLVGAVLGGACGDALGAGYEFGPPLGGDLDVEMNGGGALGWEPGEWTDDTQMALACLVPFRDRDQYLSEVEAGFRAWFASRPSDVGNQTRSVLSQPGPLAASAAAHLERNPEAAGNGSLMRTGGVAVSLGGRAPDEVADLAAAVSRLTHAHADCVDACVLWSLAIVHTARQAPDDPAAPWDWTAAIEAGVDHLSADHRDLWRGRITEAADGPPGRFNPNGWVVTAFQAALSSIVCTPVPVDEPSTHLVDALRAAVRIGDDTDTVAAIAGSLLGARWGSAAVPPEWARLVHGRRTYDEPPLTGGELMARVEGLG